MHPTNETPRNTSLYEIVQNVYSQEPGAGVRTPTNVQDPEDPRIGTSFARPSGPTSTSRPHLRRLVTDPSRRRVFGIRSFTEDRHVTPSSDRFDYELKYQRDPYGEELGENARVWLTYLDEAGSYDHNKVEGWKDTIDVLLVFTGLFSAIVSTFIAQSSQHLQQDFTQVSASLLFEMVQLQRAQISGTSPSNISASPLTPNSAFKPSTNASLVNGLWISSLTISLSTALFAVLTKQWLHHYMSPLSGSAREQAKARHFRFQGLETWKVAAIIDLLPSFLHLSLGLFLIGLVIFTVPLDIQIARVVIILTGSTYTLYFLSLLLPIWYPQCPYTTPLTIYLPYIVLILSIIVSPLTILFSFIFTAPLFAVNKSPSGIISKYGQAIFYAFRRPSRRLSLLLSLVLPKIANSLRQYLLTYSQNMKSSVFGNIQDLTIWRSKKLEKSIEKSPCLDLEAIYWLHTISSNPSIQRIIARSVSMPRSKKELDFGSMGNVLWQSRYNDVLANPSLATSWDETDLEDICHTLYLGIPTNDAWCQYFVHVLYTASADVHQHIRARHSELHNLLNILNGDASALLIQAFRENTKLRQVVWYHLLDKAPENAELAACILASGELTLFRWKIPDSGGSLYPDAAPLAAGSPSRRELDEWSFRYLARCFRSQVKDSEYGSFKASYLLVSTVYRNLVSEQPFIADQRLKQESLTELFHKFIDYIEIFDGKNVTSRFLDTFLRDILLVDAFWDGVAYRTQTYAVRCFERLWALYINETGDITRFFHSGERELQFIYRWCTQNPPEQTFIGMQLFTAGNITKLCDMLRDDTGADVKFRRCFRCLRSITNNDRLLLHIRQKYINPNLVRLYKTVPSSDTLYPVLYERLVLLRIWSYSVETSNLSIWDRDIVPIIKPKLDFPKLKELYKSMIDGASDSPLRYASYKAAYDFGRRSGFADSDSEFFVHMPVEVARSMNFESAAEMVGAFKRELGEEGGGGFLNSRLYKKVKGTVHFERHHP